MDRLAITQYPIHRHGYTTSYTTTIHTHTPTPTLSQPHHKGAGDKKAQRHSWKKEILNKSIGNNDYKKTQ